MAVKIRLRRAGKRNAPCHRIVVADGRCPRDGRFIEIVGHYDPRHKTEDIDLERADYWISNGAQPSETVGAIIKRARAGKPLGHDKPAEAPKPAAEVVAEEAPAKTEEPETADAAAEAPAEAAADDAEKATES